MNELLKDSVESTINKNTEIKKTLMLIEEQAWISLIKELPTDLSSITFSFDEDVEQLKISYDDFLKKYTFIKIQDFLNLNKENVWADSLHEIYETYNYLVWTFGKSEKNLSNLWFDVNIILDSVIERLVNQVIEAGNSNRKLKNWCVVWLSNYSDTHFTFTKVPYYAFASTNVSLDLVKVKNNNWEEYSLRDIDTLLDSRNDNWWFFLPNSMWVSVNLLTKDNNDENIFIAQVRNNSTTLTQRSSSVSSASWAVDYDLFMSWWNLDLLNHAIWAEIKEELWLDHIKSALTIKQIKSEVLWIVDNPTIPNYVVNNSINLLWNLLNQEWLDILNRELWLEANLLPVALVMEEKRRNPEFIFLWKVWYNLDEIKKSWSNSEWKDESLEIIWINFDDILDELENRKKWSNPKIGNHFLMSFYWFLLKLNEDKNF